MLTKLQPAECFGSVKSTIPYWQTACQKCHALCLPHCSPVCNVAVSHSCCPLCTPASAPLATCSITAAVSELPVYVALLICWQSLSCCYEYAACRATGCPPCVHLRLLSHLQCNSTKFKFKQSTSCFCFPQLLPPVHNSSKIVCAKSGMLLAMMQHHSPAVCNDICCLHLCLRHLSSHLQHNSSRLTVSSPCCITADMVSGTRSPAVDAYVGSNVACCPACMLASASCIYTQTHKQMQQHCSLQSVLLLLAMSHHRTPAACSIACCPACVLPTAPPSSAHTSISNSALKCGSDAGNVAVLLPVV